MESLELAKPVIQQGKQQLLLKCAEPARVRLSVSVRPLTSTLSRLCCAWQVDLRGQARVYRGARRRRQNGRPAARALRLPPRLRLVRRRFHHRTVRPATHACCIPRHVLSLRRHVLSTSPCALSCLAASCGFRSALSRCPACTARRPSAGPRSSSASSRRASSTRSSSTARRSTTRRTGACCSRTSCDRTRRARSSSRRSSRHRPRSRSTTA